MRVLLCGLLVSLLSVAPSAQYASPRGLAVFNGDVKVSLEIADTEPLRQRGLMHRRGLAPTEGMIFVFEESGFYPFWMKNTLIPLDMFWLDERGRIVSLRENVPPCGNTSETDDTCPTWPPSAGTRAIYVLETVAGFARTHGVEVGQRVVLSGVPAARR